MSQRDLLSNQELDVKVTKLMLPGEPNLEQTVVFIDMDLHTRPSFR